MIASDFWFVYYIRNTINGKGYVGIDTRNGKRWIEHKSHSTGLYPRSPLALAMRKYGVNNFTYEILEQGFDSMSDLTSAEKFWITSKNTLGRRGYNLTPGGENPLRFLRPKRRIPQWATNDKKIKHMLLQSFPKLDSNADQRAGASRWARIIYLYFRLQYTNSEVAEEMGIESAIVLGVLQRIFRVSRGRSADGRRALGIHPRGRPKKLNKSATA